MKKIQLLLLPMFAAMLTGCVVTSVYPFYQDKDLAFEPALLGKWQDKDQPDERWNFEQERTDTYQLTYSSGTNRYVMQARLFKLSGESFLDLFNAELSEQLQPPPIPAHSLLRVFQVKPSVKMAALNYDWLKELLAKEPKAVRHHAIPTGDKSEDHRIVLTAETAELQKFIRTHLKTEGAWKDVFELKQELAVSHDVRPSAH